MPDYKKMYFELFASVSDAIDILQKGLLKGEETYSSSPSEEDEIKGEIIDSDE